MTTEIEFELPSLQYELMDYPLIKQGHALSVFLDVGVLLPDPAANTWFVVQKEPLPHCFEHVGPALYAFTGEIVEADITKDDEMETATVLIKAGDVLFRALCAPAADGRLPYGTWESRTISGLAHLQGILEDDFATSMGEAVGVTVWGFRRLLLTPGDAYFGSWHESVELLPVHYRYDRLLVIGKIHQPRL